MAPVPSAGLAAKADITADVVVIGGIDKDFEKGKDNVNVVLLQLISNVICEWKKAT